jgi:cell division protein DivIC
MKLFHRIPSWIRNKYFISASAFLVWITFFDSKDLITQYQRKKELTTLRKSKSYYEKEIASESKMLEELKSNPAAIEKFAREKYLMKRDNEELFLIRKPEDKAENK